MGTQTADEPSLVRLAEQLRGRVAELVSDWRNPHQVELLAEADAWLARLVALVPFAEGVLGGSLRSETAIIGKNDIDLRLLFPQGRDSNEELLSASGTIASAIPLRAVREGLPDVPFLVQHATTIECKGVAGPVAVELSLQPRRGYVGLAAKAALLPKAQREACVAAKAIAHDASDTLYRNVKRHWGELIYWLDEAGWFASHDTSIVAAAQQQFPLFWVQ